MKRIFASCKESVTKPMASKVLHTKVFNCLEK